MKRDCGGAAGILGAFYTAVKLVCTNRFYGGERGGCPGISHSQLKFQNQDLNLKFFLRYMFLPMIRGFLTTFYLHLLIDHRNSNTSGPFPRKKDPALIMYIDKTFKVIIIDICYLFIAGVFTKPSWSFLFSWKFCRSRCNSSWWYSYFLFRLMLILHFIQLHV